MAGAFGGQIWWAANTTAQLNHIETLQRDQIGDLKIEKEQTSNLKTAVELLNASGSPQQRILETKVQDMFDRVKFMETKGSPAVTPRLEALEKLTSKLQEDFELHKATTTK